MAVARVALQCYLSHIAAVPSGSVFRLESNDGEILDAIMRLNGTTEVALRGRTVSFFLVRQWADATRVLAVEQENMGNPVSFTYRRVDPKTSDLPKHGSPDFSSLVAFARNIAKYSRNCFFGPLDPGGADAVCTACGAWVFSGRPHRRIDINTCVWTDVPAEHACELDEYKRAEGWLARSQWTLPEPTPSSP